MKKFKFPRSYSDLESAPWCDGYDPPKGQVSWDGDHLNIFVKLDWLPEEMHETAATPGGPNLKWALMDLRTVWPYTVSYTHLRAHETKANLVCRLLLEKKKGHRFKRNIIEQKHEYNDQSDARVQ